jgi:TRAP transporter 4TM/12TM fusion protein
VTGRYRELAPPLDRAVKAMAIAVIAVGALFSLGVPSALGLRYFPQQFLGFILGTTLAIVFALLPARSGRSLDRLPWYDAVAALSGMGIGAYVVVWYPKIAYEITFPTADKYLLGTLAIVLVLEACRRIYGPVLPLVAMVFVGYAAFASEFPGLLRARSIEWTRLATELYLGPEGVLGVALMVVATIVLVFVLFGQLLFAMGGGDVFTDAASAMMGRYRGGPAKVAVLGSALFGSISGSAVANVAITGTLTIPMMKRIGYRPEVAAAVEAAASTGGLVTPPVMSVVAFLMAEYLQIPYGRVVLAAALPALLYFTAILVQVDLEAGRAGIRGMKPEEVPRLRSVLKRGWAFLIPAPVLVFTLVVLFWEPAKAGMFAVLVLLVSGFWFVRDEPLRWWLETIAKVGVSVTEILAIAAVVGLIIGSAAFTGLGFTLSLPLLQLGEVSVFLFLGVTALISIVLGMGLPGIAIYFMQVALIVPALTDFGILPLAAHFFIYYFGVFSFITPPVCISAIAAASIAEAGPMRTAWEAVKLGVVAFIIPFVFVCSPSLLGEGPLWVMAVDFLTAAAGVVAVSAALRGFAVAAVGAFGRLALGASSVALFLPLNFADAAWIANGLGGVALAAILGANWRQSR